MFSSIDDVITAFRRPAVHRNRTIATVVYLASRLEKPILVEGPAGVGKTELAKVLAARARPRADPPAVLRGPRRGQGALRVGVRQAAPLHPDPQGQDRRGDRRRARRCARPSTASPARTTSSSPTASSCRDRCCGRSRRRAAGGAADRRDRQVRHRVRGLPARGADRLPGQRARARHAEGHATSRSSSSPATTPARCRTRSSGAACTSTSTSPTRRRSSRSSASRCRASASSWRARSSSVVQRIRKLDLKKVAEHQRDARLGAGADAAQRRQASTSSWCSDTLTTILKYEGDIRKAQDELKAYVELQRAKLRTATPPASDKDLLH